FTFITAPDVFSYGELDEGTRLLLETVEVRPTDRVVDLGCGYGAIGIVAASLAPDRRVVLVDTDARAVALAQRNVVLNNVPNAVAVVTDGLAATPAPFDLIPSTPPLQASAGTLRRSTEEAYRQLLPGGRCSY